MGEEQKEQENKVEEDKKQEEQEISEENSENGNKSEGIGLIDRAGIISERLEKQLKRQEDLLKRQNELYAKRMLAGRSDAGEQPEKPKEETPEEYKNRIMSGVI